MVHAIKSKGFSAPEAVLVVLVIAGLAVGGWVAWQKHQPAVQDKKTTADTQQGRHTPATSDPYRGWKTATSQFAKFSVRYPNGWTYNASVGKDGVEHLTIDSAKFHVRLDSYTGKDAIGSTLDCSDCSKTVSSKTFIAPKVGPLNLDMVIYSLDNGKGNALVLRQADGTYYLPSPNAANVYTSARAISAQDSLAAYQNENSSQFVSNSDYTMAQKILESIAY